MMLSAASIINTIFNLPLVLDIIIILFLLISTSLGCAKGFWRGTFRFLFVVLMLVIAWFFLVEPVALYVRDELFVALGIKQTLSDGTVATSLGQIIESLFSKAALDPSVDPKYLDANYIAGFVLSLCRTISWLLLVIVIQFVSWIVSSLIYFLLIRLIIPKKVREVKLRLLGGLMGLLQGVVITFALMLSFSTLSPAVAAIKNPGEGEYKWLNSYTAAVIVGLDPQKSMLAPYADSLGESLTDSLVKFEVGEDIYSIKQEIVTFVEYILSLDEEVIIP